MTVWIFLRKEDGIIVDAECYGSVRKMYQSKDFEMSEQMFRRLLTSGKFVNDVFHIEKFELKTTKHND